MSILYVCIVKYPYMNAEDALNHAYLYLRTCMHMHMDALM